MFRPDDDPYEPYIEALREKRGIRIIGADLLGQGAFGRVYPGQDTDRRDLAVKFIIESNSPVPCERTPER